MDLSRIRNFCIIAHIDHGKSTLADRLLQLTHTIADREFRDQVLDNMDLERERGITIKSHPVSMQYTARDGVQYELNLIDTPGHVDFSYEVSRSMSACEGGILVVDAVQGVEAQTVANTHMAVQRGLELIPVINKIDLPNAQPADVARQIEEILAVDTQGVLAISAKTGEGVAEVLEAIVRGIPAPRSTAEPGIVRALVFDSVYDSFKGVIVYVRVVDGDLRVGDRVALMGTGLVTEVKEVGIFSPKPKPVGALGAGQVGYFAGTIKDPSKVRVGDTVTLAANRAAEALPGFRGMRPMVFSGLYPVDTADYERFRQSMEKLSLNDSSFSFHAESSVALGFGFRCGFLGLLHMEIIQERLHREFDLDIINTHPAVIYKVYLRDGTAREIDNPVDMPEWNRIAKIEEPILRAFIICRNEDISEILKLIMDRRGVVSRTDSLDTRRVMMTCTLPLNEVLTDFHDYLKSVSRGYASMDYEPAGYQESDMVKLDILVHSEAIDAFSTLVHRSKAEAKGRQICKALKETIPQHLFTIAIQAAVNGRIIARETIRQLRKDVLAKLYGGDVTRKRKVLERQKEGKRRMKQFGTVSVPSEAFVQVLREG